MKTEKLVSTMKQVLSSSNSDSFKVGYLLCWLNRYEEELADYLAWKDKNGGFNEKTQTPQNSQNTPLF